MHKRSNKQMRYIALLRGINVGGNNIIPMSALAACFTEMGFTDVATHIQSGNVIFSAPAAPIAKLEKYIETTLSQTFSYTSVVVVIPADDLRAIIAEAPRGFGSKPDIYRYDVIFLKPPLTALHAASVIKPKEGVDTVHAGSRAVYTTRRIARATQSRISKITQVPEYKLMTIRNWNTTTKLAGLVAEPAKTQ